ncbi:TetR family transcriptional regulator [Microvirga makkahensis]|uniref:TetR family transcriptional regulator n=2 Tax=Microvirga makkahensis TaxID=1128670 RepID=A0A7X3MXL3_9HYPH|nr:TetR family transcriptional regulator [Microvirga makkahensis]
MLTLSTHKPEPNKPFHHGDLRHALIEATAELIERDGPASVSLREAARIAGVSHNAPYRHFPTREALLAAVAAHGFRQLRLAFEASAVTPENRMLALGQEYVRFALAHPGLFRLMFGSGLDRQSHPDLEQAAQDAFRVLQHATLDRGSPSPRDAALGAWALVHGLSHLIVDNQLNQDLQEDAASGRLLERIAAIYGLSTPREAGSVP